MASGRLGREAGRWGWEGSRCVWHQAGGGGREAAPRQHRLCQGGQAVEGEAAVRETQLSPSRQRALSSAQEQLSPTKLCALSRIQVQTSATRPGGAAVVHSQATGQARNMEQLAMQLQPKSRNAQLAAEQQPAIADTFLRVCTGRCSCPGGCVCAWCVRVRKICSLYVCYHVCGHHGLQSARFPGAWWYMLTGVCQGSCYCAA